MVQHRHTGERLGAPRHTPQAEYTREGEGMGGWKGQSNRVLHTPTHEAVQVTRNVTINTSTTTSAGGQLCRTRLHELKWARNGWNCIGWVATHMSPARTLVLQPAGPSAPCWNDCHEHGSLLLLIASHARWRGVNSCSRKADPPLHRATGLFRNGQGSDVASLPPRTWSGDDGWRHVSLASPHMSLSAVSGRRYKRTGCLCDMPSC